MPELPEVETVVRHLRPVLVGSKITQLMVHKAKIVSPNLGAQIAGQSILAADRYGKYIVLKLERGYLVAHLRMTGKLFTVTLTEFPQAQAQYKHLHVVFDLAQSVEKYTQTQSPVLRSSKSEAGRDVAGSQITNKLLFVDQRQFGRIVFSENLAWLHAKLGLDPLDPKFTVDWLQNKFAKLKRAAKPVLLDQSIIAGLGNIYVDEALWHAGVHPTRPVNQIAYAELQKLHAGIIQTLTLAIQKNGTTFQSYSFMGEKTGEFISYLQVFGRQNLACVRCGTKIVKLRVAQRGTHICPACQK